MISCTDNRNIKVPQPKNEVIFRDVKPRYKFQNKVSVLYVLSPKTKTSTHDYVGIYPRGWKHLREFAGFEHPIPAPFEEPSLDRCIQFICQPPHVTASLNREYQFVYVNQYNEVLGMSDFFTFVEEDNDKTNLSDCSEKYNESKMCGENNSEWHKGNSSTYENLQQHVSEAEYAYNTCYFVDNQAQANQEVTVPPNMSFGSLDEATNSPEASQARFISEESPFQNSEQELYNKPRRGRPLVKTRDAGVREYPSVADSNSTGHPTYSKNRHSGSPQDVVFTPKWLPGNTWHYQPRHSSIMFSGRKDAKRGAIPKQCPKCHVPSDYFYQQQVRQHDLDQAHEQIRDLNTTVDQLQHELQLSYAAQAKLKAVAEIARTESKNALSFLNSRMLSTIAQYKTKVNADNTMMYVPRDLESPGWFAAGDPAKPFLFGRPPNVRVVSGREKELKAIIGRQEMTIRKLYSDLKLATRIVECVNLSNNDNMCSIKERQQHLSSPQVSHFADGLSSEQGKDDSTMESSNVDKVMKNAVDVKVMDSKSKEQTCEKLDQDSHISHIMSDTSKPHKKIVNKSKESAMFPSNESSVVEPSYFQLDPIQTPNREVIVDGKLLTSSDSEDVTPVTMNETNNNDYDTKNLNSDEDGGKSKCTVCESTNDSSHDNVSGENSD